MTKVKLKMIVLVCSLILFSGCNKGLTYNESVGGITIREVASNENAQKIYNSLFENTEIVRMINTEHELPVVFNSQISKVKELISSNLSEEVLNNYTPKFKVLNDNQETGFSALYWVSNEISISGYDIEKVEVTEYDFGGGGTNFKFTLSDSATLVFENFTKKNLNKTITILVNDEVYMAPIIGTVINIGELALPCHDIEFSRNSWNQFKSIYKL